MDVKQGNIGPEASYDVQFSGGKVIFIAKYDGAQADGLVSLSVGVNLFLDKLKAAIPGAVDDAVIDLIEVALAKL